MTITAGTNGNKVSYLDAVATEWREAPRGTSSAIVIQNQGYADAYWCVSTAMPSSLQEPALLLGRGQSVTARDFSTTADRVFIRMFSESGRIAFWRG